MSKLDEALKQIEKTLGEGVVTSAEDSIGKLEVCSTGIPSLDNATGIKGLPKARITEIYGMDGTFKTTVALLTIAEAQRNGDICAFVDAEFAFSPEYAAKLGVDNSKLILVHPSSAEEAFNVMEKLIETGEIGVMCLDSIASLSPSAEIANEFGSSNMGVMARLMGQMFRKLVSKLGKSNTCLILINQLREQLGGYVPMKTTPGGNAARFYASIRIEITKSQLKEGTDVKGVTLKMKTVKNKLNTPFMTTEVEAMFGEGIDVKKDIINLAISKGIISKAGAGWMSYKDVKLQGIDKFKAFFEDNPEFFEELKSQVTAT